MTWCCVFATTLGLGATPARAALPDPAVKVFKRAWLAGQALRGRLDHLVAHAPVHDHLVDNVPAPTRPASAAKLVVHASQSHELEQRGSIEALERFNIEHLQPKADRVALAAQTHEMLRKETLSARAPAAKPLAATLKRMRALFDAESGHHAHDNGFGILIGHTKDGHEMYLDEEGAIQVAHDNSSSRPGGRVTRAGYAKPEHFLDMSAEKVISGIEDAARALAAGRLKSIVLDGMYDD